MTATLHRPARRLAFTLIELLIVIAIIGILMSLLLAAVMRAYSVVEDVRNKNEVVELHKAMWAFATTDRFASSSRGSINFPPSKLTLYGNLKTAPPGDPSVAYILSVFPSCSTTWSTTGIDWSGGNSPQNYTLEGEQVLVYFLGGPGQRGFSTNPSNPCDPNNRAPGFYDFKAARLVGSPFPAYADSFGIPFAYFNTSTPSASPATDCASVKGVDGSGVQPYVQSNNTFFNADSFQIISAGRDKKFGQNFGSWSSVNTYPAGNAGYDDYANFAANKLGSR